METLLKDLRYGIRMLLKNPAFGFIAVLTLALGIGANTAIFSVVNSILLRPLPYKNADRLAALYYKQSVPDLADMEPLIRSFEAMGGVTIQPLDYTGGSEPLQVQAGVITAGLTKALGVKPLIGRLFTAEEDRFGGERLVVLMNGFWQRQFGGDPAIVGKMMVLSGNSYRVIGVLGPEFELPLEKADVLSLVRIVLPEAAAARGVHFQRTYCLLKKNVSIGQAQAEMPAVDRRLEEIDPVENKDRETKLIPLQERVIGKTRPALLILFGAVALVLLIACGNFANLLLVRAASRQQEMVIRSALGAGRGKIMRQMLTESLLVAILGGVLGLVFASWGIDLLQSLQPENLPRLSEIKIDGRVLLFTMTVSVLTGLLFGLIPAWAAANANVNETLKESGRALTPGSLRRRLRSLLVVGELALALLLLIGAGLLIRAFYELRTMKPGFEPDHLVTMRIELPETRYEGTSEQMRFRNALLDSLNSNPDIMASMISELPFSGDWLDHNFIIEGRPPLERGTEPSLINRSVNGDYLQVMRIPLIRGRYISEKDTAETSPVGIINQAMARQYFPDQNPVGARIRWSAQDIPQWITIIGVAGDVKHFGFDLPEEPAIYTPYSQADYWKRWMSLAVRSNVPSASLLTIVKNEVWKLDKQLPITDIQTMSGLMSASLARQRFNMLMLGIFAFVALGLAAVGIYGVVSFTVAQRTHEIGIRMALGAQSRHVLNLVVGEGLILTLIGIAIGLCFALALTRLMTSLLFGVSTTDPLTFVLVAFVLSVVSILATYIPARKASKIDPMIALRYE